MAAILKMAAAKFSKIGLSIHLIVIINKLFYLIYILIIILLFIVYQDAE